MMFRRQRMENLLEEWGEGLEGRVPAPPVKILNLKQMLTLRILIISEAIRYYWLTCVQTRMVLSRLIEISLGQISISVLLQSMHLRRFRGMLIFPPVNWLRVMPD